MAMRTVRAGSQSTPSAASVQQVLDALRLGRVCPISRHPAACPVRAADGQVYERHFIQQWFDDCRRRAARLTSPVLHTPLTSDTLEPVVTSEGDTSSPTALPCEVTLAKPFQPPFFEELDKFLETPLVQMLNLRPPAIVPLGVESAGKSTILERIIGLSLLPRDEQMCTRMVIRIHLRRRRQAARMAVRVVRRSREPPFAEDAATERWTPAPDSVPGLLIAMMDDAVREAGRPIVLDKELLVEVYRADVPDLDILDVPGLVTASRAGLEDAPQLTRELIDSVIAAERAHAIFLVIVPATELLNSNTIMSVVQEAGVQQVSLGIRSKADLKVSQDPDVSQTEVVAAELVGTVPDQHGGVFKAPGFVELGLGWLGMANKMSKRMFDAFPEAARGCARLTWMEDQEVRFAQQLQADLAAADAFAFLESRFGAPAVRARVQKEFERFIVERWLTQVRDQLQREHARVTHQYAARGLPVPDERFAAAATASTPMADDLARVVRDVDEHVPGSDENIFAERRAYGADAAEFKRILAARVAEVTADRESDDADWTALQSNDQLWDTISRLESTIEAVERRNRDAAAPAAQASRLLASSKQQYHAAARIVKDTLVSYAATELVDRFMAALDSAPEHRVQLAAHGALPARTLSSQLRLLDRLPALAESLRVHAAAAVSVTVACEFSARADERIAQETAAAFQCAQSDTAAATSRGKFILRVRDGERSRQLGPDLVDAFLEVVLGGLLSAIRLWDVSEDLLVESASVRSDRLSDLKELQVVGDALIALQRLRASVDGSGGVEAEIPATNLGKVCDLLDSLPRGAV